MSGALMARIALSVAAGMALGAGFFSLLGLSVRLYGTKRWPLAIAIQLARWALLAVALVVVARAGALPLLCVTLGILIARTAVVRHTRVGRP